MIERRSILKCLVGLVAAPAIIKVSSLMPVNAALQPNSMLTIDQITREAVRLFVNSNKFLREMDEQYREDYAFVAGEQWDGAKIGDTLRIRLPSDFVVSDRPELSGVEINARYQAQHDRAYFEGEQFMLATLNKDGSLWQARENRVPQISAPLALAAAAVAVAPKVLATPVTRRFWSKAVRHHESPAWLEWLHEL